MRGLVAVLITAPLLAQTYDVVIANGRVMDPATGTDRGLFIGITAGKIARLSQTRLEGRTVIDAGGLVVAPGFIDLHQHGQTPENYRLKALDGVTTALELEAGASPVGAWNRTRVDKSLIHFGASSGHIPALMAVMHDSGTLLPRDAAANRVPTDAEHRESLVLLKQGLDEGGLGIGMGIAYVKAT